MVTMFLLLIPVVIWLALKVAMCYSTELKLFDILPLLTASLNQPFHLYLNEYSLKTILVFLFLYACGVGIYFTSSENRRPGEEHGSAKWGNVSSIARKYTDRKHRLKNLILSQSLALSLNAKSHRRNLNVLIVGGSGAGKTRFYAKPNIMQCNTSFVIADPKGEMLRATAPLLLQRGYDVKVFNLINPSDSDGYNPFTYIRTDEDVVKANIKPDTEYYTKKRTAIRPFLGKKRNRA